MAKMSPLRRRMIEDMTLRNLSRQTQQSYIYAVAKFSRHFNRPPDRLGMEDVRAYQLHLVGQKYSWSHINQVACALRFFYGITLGQKEAIERIVTGKDPEKLPPVLDYEEVACFLKAVDGMRNRVALATAYAAGLRVREVVRLKVASIDSQRMLLHIEAGKGNRDRYAMSGACPVARRSQSRFAARPVFPRRIHSACPNPRHGPPEQGHRLRHSAQGGGRHHPHHRR
jgi:integrase/recombinase XerD